MAQCLSPFQKSDGDVVPCGKCLECKARHISGWSFRLMQEDKYSNSSHFITLTYAPEHLVRTKKNFRTLHKPHLQSFIKTLRYYHNKKFGNNCIKYYACGEYGGQFGRPHYHIILFNCHTEFIPLSWPYGSTHSGTVTAASVGYTLKYLFKENKAGKHRNDDRQREFALMSKGLGIRYLSPAMRQWHLNDADNRMYCNVDDGKKIAMPRYYKQKLYTHEQRLAIGKATFARIIESEKHLDPTTSSRGNPSLKERRIAASKSVARSRYEKGNSL